MFTSSVAQREADVKMLGNLSRQFIGKDRAGVAFLSCFLFFSFCSFHFIMSFSFPPDGNATFFFLLAGNPT